MAMIMQAPRPAKPLTQEQHEALLRAVRSGLPALVMKNGVDRTGHTVYTVPSGTRDGKRHLVRADASGQPVSCTCEHISYGGRACRHMAAVWLVTHPSARVKLLEGRTVAVSTGALMRAA